MVKQLSRKLARATHDALFRAVHSRCLIYNTCWEDPRLDRQVLDIGPDTRMVMITSAGCNALDYLLDDPAEIHTVDVNPRQNALLHLKLALIARGDFEDFYQWFGEGYHPRARTLYRDLRPQLPDYAQQFWDAKLHYFEGRGRGKSFYYHGTSGVVAWLMRRFFLEARSPLRHQLHALLEAQNLAEQREIYRRMEPELWGRFSAWVVKQPTAMAMLGVPRPQIQLINAQYDGGLAEFINRQLRHVLTEVLISDNYFWRVYFTGRYTPSCCPNYLRAENFNMLRERLERIFTYNTTISEFLHRQDGNFQRFVLLDHQDWLTWHAPEALDEEWRLIFEHAAADCRVLLRSASSELYFLPDSVRQRLDFRPQLTDALHGQDRVGTYGSMHLAEVRP